MKHHHKILFPKQFSIEPTYRFKSKICYEIFSFFSFAKMYAFSFVSFHFVARSRCHSMIGIKAKQKCSTCFSWVCRIDENVLKKKKQKNKKKEEKSMRNLLPTPSNRVYLQKTTTTTRFQRKRRMFTRIYCHIDTCMYILYSSSHKA